MSLPINQMGGGGGLNDAALALANATPADVAAGKTFYAGGKELKTGEATHYYVESYKSTALSGSSTKTVTITAAGATIDCAAVFLSEFGTSPILYTASIKDGIVLQNKCGESTMSKISLSGNVITVSAYKNDVSSYEPFVVAKIVSH